MNQPSDQDIKIYWSTLLLYREREREHEHEHEHEHERKRSQDLFEQHGFRFGCQGMQLGVLKSATVAPLYGQIIDQPL